MYIFSSGVSFHMKIKFFLIATLFAFFFFSQMYANKVVININKEINIQTVQYRLETPSNFQHK